MKTQKDNKPIDGVKWCNAMLCEKIKSVQ